MKINRHMFDTYTVDGLPGQYVLTKRMGGFVGLSYQVLNDDGIGLKTNVFLGSIPFESWDPPSVNSRFREAVESRVSAHANGVTAIFEEQ